MRAVRSTTRRTSIPTACVTSLSPATQNGLDTLKLGNNLLPSFSTLGPFPESTLGFLAVIESAQPLNPYVQSWTLSIERELARNTTLELNYVGTKGTHLLNRHDIAQQLDIPAASLSLCSAAEPKRRRRLLQCLWRSRDWRSSDCPVQRCEPSAVSELQRVLYRQRLPRLLHLPRRQCEIRASRRRPGRDLGLFLGQEHG